MFLFLFTFFVHSDDDLINCIKNKIHIHFIYFHIYRTKNNKMDYNNEIFEPGHTKTPNIYFKTKLASSFSLPLKTDIKRRIDEDVKIIINNCIQRSARTKRPCEVYVYLNLDKTRKGFLFWL